MKYKNCNSQKSYNCGRSCIRKSYACRIGFPVGVSQSIADRTISVISKGNSSISASKANMQYLDEAVKLRTLPQEEEVFRDHELGLEYFKTSIPLIVGGAIDEDFKRPQVDTNELERVKTLSNGSVYEINWEVMRNTPGNYRSTDPKDQLKTALGAKKMWVERVAPTLKEGDILVNMPLEGVRGARDAAYRRFGFGYVDGEKGKQMAIYHNGKLEPVNLFRPDIEAYTDTSVSSKRALPLDTFKYWLD